MKIQTLIEGLICIFLAVVIILNINRKVQIDENTKFLCQQYAERDHQGEIAPERWAKLGAEFFNNYPWYQSCLDHNSIPVAK